MILQKFELFIPLLLFIIFIIILMIEFDYSESLLSIRNDYEIRHIPSKMILTSRNITIPDDYYSLDLYNTDKNKAMSVGYHNREIIVVTTHKKKKKGLYFKIMRYNKNLDLIDIKLHETKKRTYAHEILRNILGKLPFNEESIIDHLAPCNYLPYGYFIKDDYVLQTDDHMANILAMCYDKYSGNIVIIRKAINTNHYLEYWSYNEEPKYYERYLNWTYKKSIKLDIFAHFHILFCTRKYIVINFQYYSSRAKTVLVYDKYTLDLLYTFYGSHVTCIDDYDEWKIDRIQLLSEITCLNKLSTSLLKIIVLYVN